MSDAKVTPLFPGTPHAPKAETRPDQPAPWFRFFASKWLAATRGLSASESGILIHMLAMMHENGGPIPVDYKGTARLIGTKPVALKAAIQTLISRGLLTRSEHGFWSDMMDREFSFRSQVRTRSAPKASKPQRKRQQNQSQNRHIQKSQNEEYRGNDHRGHSPTDSPSTSSSTIEGDSSSTFEGSRDARGRAPTRSKKPESTFCVGALIEVEGEDHELEYQQQDGRWRARSVASGDYRTVEIDADGVPVADAADDIPF